MTNNTRCEDYPCCGHELGDCNGGLYGTDESIIAQVEKDWTTGHGYCDHAEGIYNCDNMGYDEDEDDEDEEPDERDDTPYMTEDYDPRVEETAAEYDDFYN